MRVCVSVCVSVCVCVCVSQTVKSTMVKRYLKLASAFEMRFSFPGGSLSCVEGDGERLFEAGAK